MSGRTLALAALGAAAATLAGCAARAPVTMPAQYQPAYEPVRSARGAPALCAVRVAEVRDLRTDPHILGDTGGQPVRAEDSGAWIGSALRSLDGQAGLTFVDRPQADGGELVMNVELLKAYTVHMATDRAATVVIKVRYSRRGAPIGEQIYRGAVNGLNWSDGADETLGSLSDALGKLLEPVRKDITRHCAGG